MSSTPLRNGQPEEPPEAPRRRIIALGASNLTRMLPCLLRTARAHSGMPVDLQAAFGFGRSFGKSTRFLGRVLPGLDACGIWQAIGDAAVPQQVPCATGIIMDVGNDIFYGVEAETLLDWVERSLVLLKPHCDRIVLAGVPPTVAKIGKVRFGLMRRFLVPSCRMELGEGLRRAAVLHDGLRDLADKHGAIFLEHEEAWFAWDAIHVKRRYWRTFAEGLLIGDSGGAAAVSPAAASGRVSSLRLRTARPEQRRLFGREQCTKQPAVRLRDGSTVAIF